MTVRIARAALALLVCAALASCSSSGGGPGPGDTTPPGVTQVNLTDGQTDVGLIHRISVTFSEDMDESTIGDTTVIVSGRAPRGHVDYDDATRTVTFTPDTLYAAQTWHSFILSGEIADEAGNTIEPDTTAFQTGPLDTDHLDDYFEPNGSAAAAVPIELGRRYRTLSITDGDDDDVFVFTVVETSKVRIHAWMKEVQGLSWVRAFERADGEEYWAGGTGADTGDEYDSFWYTFHPGTYYFHTYAHSYQTGWLVYDFELYAAEPCRDDYFEDNDFIEDCGQVVEGTVEDLRGCYSDNDWYWLDLDAGEELTVTVTATGGDTGGTKRITLYNHNMTDVAVTTSGATSLQAAYTATVTGPHYIKVMFWNDDVEYGMDVDID
ncbi:MAG: Ig-like domain-containing protein [Candidatus Eisenbacteria bacterium]